MKFVIAIAILALNATLTYAVSDCPAPQLADHTRYCDLGSYGVVSLIELTQEEYNLDLANGKSVFAPNSSYPSKNGIFYDCECEPTCDYHLEADEKASFAQIGLNNPRFSYFHNDTFHYCIAIPTRSVDNHLYFQDANGEEIHKFNCESTKDLNDTEDCEGWKRMAINSPYHYRHACYETYCVDAQWNQLSPYYTAHTDEYWTTSYTGVVVSSSHYKQKVCHTTGECEYVTPLTYTAPNLFSISATIHVAAHLGDIRIYSPAVVVAYETAHSTVFSEFEWGLDNNVSVIAQIFLTTRIQAPLFVTIDNFTASNFNGTKDLFAFGMSERCQQRPEGYKLDGTDLPCKQEWLITLNPEYEDCGIDTILELVFHFDCDPFFYQQRGECPFVRGVESNQVSFEFDFSTDNWCDVLDIDIEPPKALMDSYVNADCAQADDFLPTERPHYEVSLEGNEYLTVTGSSLSGLHIATTCSDNYGSAGWFVVDGNRTHMANGINLVVDNTPARTCMGASSGETVRFYFDLSSEFFHPPKKASCEFVVWAIIELEYLGFGQDNTLLSVGLTQDNPAFGDSSPVNMGSIRLEGSYSAGEEGSASTVSSLTAATLAMIAIPALL